MSLANPDTRRGLRAVIEAVVALALIGLLYWLTHLLSGSATGLITIARGSLMIVGLGTLFYGAENVSRAISLTGPLGWGAKFGSQDDAAAKAAQTTAAAAQDTADAITEGSQP